MDLDPYDESKAEQKRNCERLITLASRFNIDVIKVKNRLVQAKVPYNELSNLTFEDYIKLGLVKEADHMVRAFKKATDQAVGYNQICEMPEARAYNEEILEEALQNLMNLDIALVETSLNMCANPPQDVVVGDKYYASKFLVEALTQLHKATKSLQKELNYFVPLEDKPLTMTKPKSSRKSRFKSGLFYSILTLSLAIGTLFIWKLRKP